MSSVISKFSELIKPHLVSVELQPKVEVDYSTFDHDMKPQYRKKWEELLAVIDPKSIEDRKWTDYNSGYKFEELSVNFEGVKLKLRGALYDSPVTRRPGDQPTVLSQQENADQILTNLFSQGYGSYGANIVWAFQHGTKEKVDATLSMLATAAGKTTLVSDEVIQKSAEKVLTMLRMAKDLSV